MRVQNHTALIAMLRTDGVAEVIEAIAEYCTERSFVAEDAGLPFDEEAWRDAAIEITAALESNALQFIVGMR